MQTEESDSHLVREARVFCAYLIGAQVSAYITRKYVAYHGTRDDMDAQSAGAFERLLVALARLGGLTTRLGRCL